MFNPVIDETYSKYNIVVVVAVVVVVVVVVKLRRIPFFAEAKCVLPIYHISIAHGRRPVAAELASLIRNSAANAACSINN